MEVKMVGAADTDLEKVTLMELLDSREKRVAHQQELLEAYGSVLISIFHSELIPQ